MYFRLLTLVAAIMLSVSAGNAYGQTATVATPAGLLRIRSASKGECATKNYPIDCQVIELDARILFANAFMNIDEIYPTADNPKIVIASSSNGGNCCKPETLLFDFTRSPPLILENAPYYDTYDKDAKLVGFTNGVVYKGYSDDTADLGEPVWQGCSTLSTEAPLEEWIETGESGSVAILAEG